MLDLVLLAFALAMDATAVAAARALAAPRIRGRDVVWVASLFGGFQALMPALGWLVGLRIGAIDWLACALLTGIGVKMLWEARKPDEAIVGEPFARRTLFLLAIATSIDALAAGITLPSLNVPIGVALATIGLVTAALSTAGMFIGRRFSRLLGHRLDIAGGLILIVLGFKVLLAT